MAIPLLNVILISGVDRTQVYRNTQVISLSGGVGGHPNVGDECAAPTARSRLFILAGFPARVD